jgi:hypothetical protein
MLTEVKKPREVFYMPQRLLVPLFQRPYVWSKEGQWEPLWNDVLRVAEKILNKQETEAHFLGAVVLQQQPADIGALPVRTVIDGQQRLTTLQLLLDAVHEEVGVAGFEAIAKQVQDLVENAEHFVKDPEDRYKVWPTNRDREAFNEVMSASAPIEYDSLENTKSKMVQCHRYFAQQANEWLHLDENVAERANSLVQTVSTYLQLVVIELLPNEDAQEIFETLNARGTPLTPADLIKNLIFQKLDISPGQAEKAYHEYWEAFETPFWEMEVSSGRIKYSRSSLFLTHWLISKTALEIPAREIFSQFKRYVNEYRGDVLGLLKEISLAAKSYRELIEAAEDSHAEINEIELFVYRTASMDSDVSKPLLIWLLDKSLPEVSAEQMHKTLHVIESWMVRRSIIRLITKGYNKLFISLLQELQSSERSSCGDITERFFAKKTAESDYWPGDSEVRDSLLNLEIYRKMSKPRLRMFLEAIEDHRRGFSSARALHEQRVVRGKCSIEHIMPQEWEKNWNETLSDSQVRDRESSIQRIGNLTLLVQALNSKVSNGPWQGDKGKRQSLIDYTSLFITQDATKNETWNEELISLRTEQMAEDVIEIWPVPDGHVGVKSNSESSVGTSVTVADLVHAGMLEPGQLLYSRRLIHAGRHASVGSDGRIYFDEQAFMTPSGAAKALSGSVSEAGWWFWLVDVDGERSLSDLRREYLEAFNESQEFAEAD